MKKATGEKRETVTIRVSPKTNAALNMVVGKMQAASPETRIRQDDVIWRLIQQGEPEVAEMVEKAATKDERETEQH